jgi:hypothetical protein
MMVDALMMMRARPLLILISFARILFHFVSVARQKQLILVGCEPCVANAITYSIFLSIKNPTPFLTPTLRIVGGMSFMPKQAHKSGLLLI